MPFCHHWRIASFASIITLAACSTSPYVQQANACRQATTHGQMFGTPERPGPCWGPRITTSAGYGLRYYHMYMPTGGQAILMYDGDNLISVTLG